MSYKRCFVVMGYGIRPDNSSGKKINLDRVYQEIIRPVVIECGYECIRGDEVPDSGLIDESMYYGILESDLVVADISTLNPNAIYELGVRHGVRKFRTIIMMESQDKFFFDLNHNRTITYSYHRTKKVFDLEAQKVRDRLKNIILEIEKKEQTDSPLYHFVPDLREPVRGEKVRTKEGVSKSVYQRIKDATNLRKKAAFEEAFTLFENLSKEIPSDSFFRQQMALCKYKSQKPSELESLQEALNILEPISKSTDPETNGLIGAIHKSIFLLNGSIDELTKAIDACKKAYVLYDDYYNGENYAFCQLLKSTTIADEDEKIALKYVSKQIYKDVFDKNKDIDEDEINTDYEIWMLATLSSCALVLGDIEGSSKFEKLFLTKADNMMKSSFREQKKKLLEILNK